MTVREKLELVRNKYFVVATDLDDVKWLIQAVDELESSLGYILNEVKTARLERQSRIAGGMHTNGPMPRLYALPESGLHMLEREASIILKESK